MRSEGQPVGFETDEQLGIGEDDIPALDLKAALAHPDLAKLIDAAVMARVNALGANPSLPGDGISAIVAGIEKLTTMHAAQMPGYSRPLPADEIERRASGFVEMNALLDHYRKEGLAPRYRLNGEPLYAGEIHYEPDSEVTHYLYPNEHMVPLNEPARKVHMAMMQWIGGPTPDIGSRLEQAERESRAQSPESTPFAPAGLPDRSPVQIVSEPASDRRSLGRQKAAHEIMGPAPVHQVG